MKQVRKFGLFVLGILSVLLFQSNSLPGSVPASNAPTGVSIKSPHPKLEINFVSCNLIGDDAQLVFAITNHGTALETYRIRGSQTGMSKAHDEFGNEYWIQNLFGRNDDNNGREAYQSLSTDIPVKVVTTIFKVDPNARKFTEVKINGYSYDSSYETEGDIVFRNIPIQR